MLSFPNRLAPPLCAPLTGHYGLRTEMRLLSPNRNPKA